MVATPIIDPPVNRNVRIAAARKGVRSRSVCAVHKLLIEVMRDMVEIGIGMTRFQCLLHILAPQALRGSLPALVNEFTLIVKTTPLASVIAVTELTYAGQLIVARTYEATPVMIPIVLGYLLVCWPILLLARRLETRLSRARSA